MRCDSCGQPIPDDEEPRDLLGIKICGDCVSLLKHTWDEDGDEFIEGILDK